MLTFPVYLDTSPSWQQNLIEIGVDAVLSPPRAKATGRKPFWERWGTRTAVIATILAIIGGLPDLPEKIGNVTEKWFSSQHNEEPQLQKLVGQIRDENGVPLPGVTVILPEYRMTATTDDLGTFEFEVKAPYQVQVKLQASKEGYRPIDYDPPLGEHFHRFKMRRAPK